MADKSKKPSRKGWFFHLKFRRAAHDPAGALFPLYHSPANLSIGNFNKAISDAKIGESNSKEGAKVMIPVGNRSETGYVTKNNGWLYVYSKPNGGGWLMHKRKL